MRPDFLFRDDLRREEDERDDGDHLVIAIASGMNAGRRNLLKGLGCAGIVGACRLLSAEATPHDASVSSGVKEVRFCLFADLHYAPGCFPHDTELFLDKIIARAKSEKVDFILHLGDLIHRAGDPKTLALVERYNRCGIPAYHTIGNHDNDGGDEAATLAAFGLKRGYYHFDVRGFRFIVCDCNYIRHADGSVEHYANCNYYSLAKDEQTSWLPDEQIAWLADAIEHSPGPCIICSHQSFERERGGVPNYHAVREVLDSANRRHPGRVLLVMNGHEHIDNLRILNGILYYDVNSANFQWFNKRHSCYSEDYCRTHTMAAHTLAWTEPLSAIVSLSADGRIRIKGSQADWMYGVTPEKANLSPLDTIGRPILPIMQSADIRLGF